MVAFNSFSKTRLSDHRKITYHRQASKYFWHFTLILIFSLEIKETNGSCEQDRRNHPDQAVEAKGQ
jgi:hypothetical protein